MIIAVLGIGKRSGTVVELLDSIGMSAFASRAAVEQLKELK